MRIITYTSSDAPKGHESSGAILLDGEIMPVRFFGSTEEEIREKAQKFWDSELERFSKVDGRTKAGKAQKAA